MENTNSTDVQMTVNNFEAVVASGDVKLVAQNDEVKLYQDSNGTEYIYDGSNAYSETSDEFAQMKTKNFGDSAAG